MSFNDTDDNVNNSIIGQSHPQVLIVLKLFDIRICSQSESGRQMHLPPPHFSFGLQEGAFYRGQFVIWPRILIIIMNNDKHKKLQ